jgi:hypothetical protein
MVETSDMKYIGGRTKDIFVTAYPGFIHAPGLFRTSSAALTIMAVPSRRNITVVLGEPVFPPAKPSSTGPAKEPTEAMALTRATPEARRPGEKDSRARTKNGA